MLGRLFRRMDGCARHHGLERVDVIGDAYIACCNFTKQHEDDHAVRCATFAVAVMRAAQSTLIYEADPALGHVKLRIGMHVGPVAGKMLVYPLPCLRLVCGSLTTARGQGCKYTIFGDAVNMASRMESTSLATRIQCTDEMAVLLCNPDSPFHVHERAGRIDVKGKVCPFVFGLAADWR